MTTTSVVASPSALRVFLLGNGQKHQHIHQALAFNLLCAVTDLAGKPMLVPQAGDGVVTIQSQ